MLIPWSRELHCSIFVLKREVSKGIPIISILTGNDKLSKIIFPKDFLCPLIWQLGDRTKCLVSKKGGGWLGRGQTSHSDIPGFRGETGSRLTSENWAFWGKCPSFHPSAPIPRMSVCGQRASSMSGYQTRGRLSWQRRSRGSTSLSLSVSSGRLKTLFRQREDVVSHYGLLSYKYASLQLHIHLTFSQHLKFDLKQSTRRFVSYK